MYWHIYVLVGLNELAHPYLHQDGVLKNLVL